jgi:hypothetical protein
MISKAPAKIKDKLRAFTAQWHSRQPAPAKRLVRDQHLGYFAHADAPYQIMPICG